MSYTPFDDWLTSPDPKAREIAHEIPLCEEVPYQPEMGTILGINEPPDPEVGECYYNTKQKSKYVWDGQKWHKCP